MTENGDKTELTLLLEVKAQDMRMADKHILNAQEIFFKNPNSVQWELVTDPAAVTNLLEKFTK